MRIMGLFNDKSSDATARKTYILSRELKEVVPFQ